MVECLREAGTEKDAGVRCRREYLQSSQTTAVVAKLAFPGEEYILLVDMFGAGAVQTSFLE